MRLLITGSAGFIGFHLARRLLEEGHEVLGVDGFTPYYDVALKRARHAILKAHASFFERELMLEDMAGLDAAAREAAPDVIVHLAAQAGVRYSVENPRAYIESNLIGTFNVLEVARAHKAKHLLIASTSSVYGDNEATPFREWQAGRIGCIHLLDRYVLGAPGDWQMIPTTANGQSAAAVYHRDESGTMRAHGIVALATTATGVSRVIEFHNPALVIMCA